MQIQLTQSVYIWNKGQILDVDRIIPHGGYGDDPRQYVVKHDGKDIPIGASAAAELAVQS